MLTRLHLPICKSPRQTRERLVTRLNQRVGVITDQGPGVTLMIRSKKSNAFTDVLKQNGVKISMDGKGRALDNIFIERFWRSLKYEEIYLKEYETAEDLKKSLSVYFLFYNTERPHKSLETATPDEYYYSALKAAA